MMKSFSLPSIALVLFAIISCDNYDLEETILIGVDNLDFQCFEKASDYYFKGVFGEDSICASEGSNDYKSFFGIGNGFITLTPSFDLGDLQNQESKSWVEVGMHRALETGRVYEEIRIKSQPMKFGTPMDSMVRAFLVEGFHPIRSLVSEDSISIEGFELEISKRYENSNLNPDHWMIQCTSALGLQSSDSYFNILEVRLDQSGEFVVGHIHLVFSCKLYHLNAGELTGEFAKDFSGEAYLPIQYKL